MGRAGFVLVGGKSSRMGRDKALLELGSDTLAELVAAQVERAAGTVILVGNPDRYRHLPFTAIADGESEMGPLAGVVAALNYTMEDWNLIVACDMPAVSAELLTSLFEQAEASNPDVLLP